MLAWSIELSQFQIKFEPRNAIKSQAMADFIAGRAQLQVATTVIEVGVDVPQALMDQTNRVRAVLA